jgi:hypothetical protein
MTQQPRHLGGPKTAQDNYDNMKTGCLRKHCCLSFRIHESALVLFDKKASREAQAKPNYKVSILTGEEP